MAVRLASPSKTEKQSIGWDGCDGPGLKVEESTALLAPYRQGNQIGGQAREPLRWSFSVSLSWSLPGVWTLELLSELQRLDQL